MPKEKKESPISTILSFAGGYKKLTFLGCFLSAIAGVLGLLPYIFIYMAVNNLLIVYPNFSQAEDVSLYGILAVVFAVLNVIIYFFALMMTHISAFRIARNIRFSLTKHVISLPMGYFQGSESGRIRKLIDDNAALTEDILAHKFPDITQACIAPIAAIILLFIFDWRMGILCIIPMILAVGSMAMMMGGKNANFYSTYQEENTKMAAEAVEYVRGIPVVKVFQQTVYSFKAFHKAIMSYSKVASDYANSCRIGQTCFLTSITSAFLFLIPALFLILKSGANPLHTVSTFIFYCLFGSACGAMINRLMYASDSMMMAQESAKTINKILAEKPLAEAKEGKKPASAEIKFDNVCFSYTKDGNEVLHNLSFTIKEGECTAIVGPSGGGKTTVASLIPRFYDVNSGSITIGGVDVRDINSALLMDTVAFVFQDTRLFKKSIYENVLAGKKGASREEVLAALKDAQCTDIIEKLPNGVDTELGSKGIHLSGGECQRIALARAILKDAPVVILDEATAFADPENEVLIQKAFSRLTKGKTVLMIAHRLSTVTNCDKIIVLDKGRAEECASHDELIKANGLYKKMWDDYQKSTMWKISKEEEA